MTAPAAEAARSLQVMHPVQEAENAAASLQHAAQVAKQRAAQEAADAKAKVRLDLGSGAACFVTQGFSSLDC